MNDAVLCIRCWRQMPVREAFYECASCSTSRGAARWMKRPDGQRQRVKDQAGNRWQRLLADESAWPRCARHRKIELLLFCECEQPFSTLSLLEEVKSFRLGFAGADGSGKTVLIATMVEEFRRQDHGGSEVGLVGVDGTDKRFDVLASRLLQEKRKPKGTRREIAGPEAAVLDPDEPRNFCWRIHVGSATRKPSPVGLLTVYDVAGETWQEPHHKHLEVFDRYLSQVSALVFLVDGAPLAEDLGLDGTDAWSPQRVPGDGGRREQHWMSRIVERLKERAREVDLALVISKADLLWEHDKAQVLKPGTAADTETQRRHIEEILNDSGRRGLLNAARGAFRKVELFAASSLGFKPTAHQVAAGGALRPDLEPVGVVEPLRWLLRQQVRRVKDWCAPSVTSS